MAWMKLALLWVVVAGATVAHAQSVSYDGSLTFATGRYTLDESVSTFILSNSVSYTTSTWWGRVTLPVINQDSASVRYVGGMPTPGDWNGGGDHGHHGGGDYGHHGGGGGGGMPGNHDPQQVDFQETGIADPYLSAGLIVFRDVLDRNSIAAHATVKAPVANSERGFGTGEWDLGLGASWSLKTPRNALFVSLTYWSMGDPPDIDFQDPVAVELSYVRVLRDSRYQLGVSLWGGTEITDGVEGPVELDLTVSRSLASGRSLYLTAGAGLTESAPDYAVTFGFRTDLWGAR